MVAEFKAELIDNKLVVKPIIEKKDGNVTIRIPSFPLIHKLKKELEKQNGKRNIQQI